MTNHFFDFGFVFSASKMCKNKIDGILTSKNYYHLIIDQWLSSKSDVVHLILNTWYLFWDRWIENHLWMNMKWDGFMMMMSKLLLIGWGNEIEDEDMIMLSIHWFWIRNQWWRSSCHRPSKFQIIVSFLNKNLPIRFSSRWPIRQ